MNTSIIEIADPKIESVVVYRQGAQIHRKANFQLKSGRQEIVFTALSPSLNAESLRILTPENIQILSIQHSYDYFQTGPKSKELADLKAQKTSLLDSIDQHELRIKILQKRLDVLVANQEKETNSAQDLQAWLDYHERISESIYRDQYKARKSIQALKEELKKVDNQIQTLSPEAADKMSEIRITVDNTMDGTQVLELMYMVNNASWQPAYDIKATNAAQLEWHYKAIIQQSTSEDWKNVRLSLSNAQPYRSTQIPILYPWYIDYQNKRLYASRMAKENLELAEDQTVMEEAELSVSAIETNALEYSTRVDMEIAEPFTLTSSGDSYTLGLNVHLMDTKFERVCFPRIQKDVFLKAFIMDWQQYNFLPGQANLYVDNAYVGNTFLNTEQSGDTLEISLGIDQSVLVERKLKTQEGRKKLFGSNKLESRRYQYIVRNRKNEETVVSVYDQIPLARRTDIEVNVEELSGGLLDKETGIIRWQTTVAPKTEYSFEMAYNVKYPKNQHIPLY